MVHSISLGIPLEHLHMIDMYSQGISYFQNQ
jgi:hypothetical protein